MARNRNLSPERTRCVDGRLMRHDPQPDDPYLETDIGQCPECEGEGCAPCDCSGKITVLARDFVAGIETFACDKCREAA